MIDSWMNSGSRKQDLLAVLTTECMGDDFFSDRGSLLPFPGRICTTAGDAVWRLPSLAAPRPYALPLLRSGVGKVTLATAKLLPASSKYSV